MLFEIASQLDMPVLAAVAALGASFASSLFRLGTILVRERRRLP